VLSAGGNLARPGALRVVAEAIAASDAVVICLHGIDPGDALALATRFARGYAYRGAQALLWSQAFIAREVQDRYLPVAPRRPFDRRGILQVDGAFAGATLSLVATQFAAEREASLRELRFARRVIRSIVGIAVVFVAGMTERTRRIGFADLGATECAHDGDLSICSRGTQLGASIVRV
jgi:hypothetical protein